MNELMEAYVETFDRNHIDTATLAQATNAPEHMVFLINQIVEAKLQPYREMVIHLVKQFTDVNAALDQAYIHANDLEQDIAALKQTLVTSHRLRHIFQHNHLRAQHQLL